MIWLWLVLLPMTGEESLFTATPSGWRSEVFPFPLEFAPDIALTGREELRFAPGMLKPEAPDFFSYAFIWWLDGRPAINDPGLQSDLLSYFTGLYQAVSQKENKDTSGFKVSIRATREPAWIEGAAANYRGTVDWIEPFRTEKPLRLHLKIAAWYCAAKDRTAVYFLVSPQDAGHEIWVHLHGLRAGSCD